ncbi:MAG: cupin protein [Sediminibacterium sp.]|nr:cupin protein [Sediminibacterium sp.]
MDTITYLLHDNGQFPNSKLPVIHHKNAIDLPFFRSAHAIEKIFEENGWTNNWDSGIYTYHHYHSITHEAFGVYKGRALLLLGGENGKHVVIQKGDVIIIPAGVAHKNMGKEEDALCIGGYPEGKDFDMNYGNPGERPQTDLNIAGVPIPSTDPVFGMDSGLVELWKQAT